MKIKDEYLLQNIADQWIVVSTDTMSCNFNKVFALNNVGRALWEQLEDGSDEGSLVDAMTAFYGIDRATAQADVSEFVRQIKELGCVDDE